jgi:lipopolysaccharide transport system ATP-binding protein
MVTPAIRVEGIGKKYRLTRATRAGGYRTLRESLTEGAAALAGRLRGGARASTAEDFWALSDVSFDVRPGQVVGIVGRNGAGKSTLLKILSRITRPTTGRIEIVGRVGSLLEVGTGFHPELTGRENIYLNGSILGMRRREIAAKLDRIIDFSGVRAFIDTPTKHYSWGMYVRLGFSVAAHLNADIVLLDEVLAVGDAAFQEKCLARLGDLRRDGRTVLLISHDLAAVQALCGRALLLEQGRVVVEGPPVEVVERYRQLIATGAGETVVAGSGAQAVVEIHSVELCDETGLPCDRARTGHPLRVRIAYTVNEAAPNPMIALAFRSYEGLLHCQVSTEGPRPLSLEPGKGTLEFQCPEIGLRPGVYYAEAFVKPDASTWQIASRQRSAMLRVEPGRPQHGQFFMTHTWSLGGR